MRLRLTKTAVPLALAALFAGLFSPLPALAAESEVARIARLEQRLLELEARLADQEQETQQVKVLAASGAATGGKYAVKFSPDEGLAWKLELPDKGCSTPIVWGDKIIVTSPDSGKDTVICLDWKGKIQWSKSLGAEIRGKHVRGSGSKKRRHGARLTNAFLQNLPVSRLFIRK